MSVTDSNSVAIIHVFDLDGTLADGEHRLHYICEPCGKPKEQKDWKGFFSECLNDEPIYSTIDILKSIATRRYFTGTNELILVLTARSDVAKKETLIWLNKHVNFKLGGENINPIDFLIMRPSGNRVQDDILKPEQLELFLRGLRSSDNPKFRNVTVGNIYEDRSRVVRAWRKKGYKCLQVSDGDF